MITLFTAPTGNGHRASIMLEEVGLPYEARRVNFTEGEHLKPEFLAINPAGKIPAIIDPDAPGGPLAVAETLAIAVYLAEKTGKLIPTDLAGRSRALQWGAALVSGPSAVYTSMFFARQLGEEQHAPYMDKCRADITRFFTAMDKTLGESRYLAGDSYSYADVLAITLVIGTATVFNTDLTGFANVARWRDEVAARPAVIAGRLVPAA
ncbi:glutathione S-transferase family protein [Phenylobacterium aquaticum]|uniref:glutathione S-transferase family protein n=1 Tax=Phenylobacterium aquaticum TaxID=1763816 RepID=UPI0026EF8E63|nr:glutathione S-transferase [Phenylobacterium aquaticum]